MDFREFPPSSMAASIVDAFWTLTSHGESVPSDAGLVTPDGCVELVFSTGGSSLFVENEIRNGKTNPARGVSFVLGLTTKPCQLNHEPPVRLFGIRLRAAAAVRLFGGDLAATTDMISPADDLIPQFTNRVAEILTLTTTPHTFDRIAGMLIDAMPDVVSRQADRAGRALSEIMQTNGAICLSALSRELGVSSRQLDRDFDQYLGMCPKLFARISRFRAAWESSFDAAPESWASIAYRLGYADQAHLCREFHEFSGLTPRQTVSFG